jgi:hypothetical protein
MLQVAFDLAACIEEPLLKGVFIELSESNFNAVLIRFHLRMKERNMHKHLCNNKLLFMV